MQRQGYVFAIPRVLFAFLVLAAAILVTLRVHAQAEEHPRQAGNVCRGFVVLPTGIAVMSGMPVSHAPGGAHTPHAATHAGGAMPPALEHSRMQPMGGQAANAPSPLLGYTHGQAIVPQADMLCVPLSAAGTVTWTAIGPDAALTVTAESLKGALTRGSRTNAALTLIIRQGSVPVEQTQVQLLARMPHHDQRMPGGHGPANDPDVQGIVAQPAGQGRYTIPTVDLTVGGPWLFEVHVQRGAETYKAYFAADVGEE
jgi:hypothetical protein